MNGASMPADLDRSFPAWLATARAEGADLSSALAAASGLPEAALRDLLAHRFDFDLAEQHADLAAALRTGKIPYAECRRRVVLPLEFSLAGQAVALSDPWDFETVQWLADRLGTFPRLVWMKKDDLLSLLDEAADAQAPSALTGHPAQGSNTGNESLTTRTISLESIDTSSSSVVKFVDAVILDAWKSGASDIHFETRRDGLEVKFRLDGVLVSAARFDNSRPPEEILNRIKVLAQLDVGETRIPQDGRFRVRIQTRNIDLRVSIMPSIFGEDAVIRLLDKAQLRDQDKGLTLEKLGFPSDAIATIRRLAHEPHGMLLVTGPTGSGKTTTLYAALSEIHDGTEKIITIEDPVEYELSGVLQIPVNEKKGLTFARGLRSILRHDPDRILVGEIRDPETAEIAVQAALTGHLVFTTVHANNVYDVVGRFLHMGVDPYNFMSALVGIAAQRLVRLVCKECAIADDDPASHARLMAAGFPASSTTPVKATGCPACRNTGYRGRVAIAEILPVDDQFREMVIRRDPVRLLREHARGLGIVPLQQRALQLVADATTTLQEVDRVVAAGD